MPRRNKKMLASSEPFINSCPFCDFKIFHPAKEKYQIECVCGAIFEVEETRGDGYKFTLKIIKRGDV